MRILLTGATGFLGMETLARLAAAGEEVVCVVRGDRPDLRLRGVLDLMGVTERDGVSAVAGDVTAALPDVGALDAVVHCAASVSFGLPLDEARRINVGGTRNALAAATRSGARYVHVSTAYVAGRHGGLFEEDSLFIGQPFRNTYEQTKAEAEELVRAAGVDTVVLRPSIVIGESATGWTPTFNVLYWPLRAFSRGLFTSVPALPEGRVDVVPVDYVADAIDHVVRERPDVTGTLALVAGEGAVTVDALMDLACDALGAERPPLVAVPSDPGSSDLADRSAEAARYLPYFDMDVVFGDARSRAVLEPAGITVPPLESYFDRIVAYAQEARWGKASVPRRVAA